MSMLHELNLEITEYTCQLDNARLCVQHLQPLSYHLII